jgi:hypothetical protein
MIVPILNNHLSNSSTYNKVNGSYWEYRSDLNFKFTPDPGRYRPLMHALKFGGTADVTVTAGGSAIIVVPCSVELNKVSTAAAIERSVVDFSTADSRSCSEFSETLPQYIRIPLWIFGFTVFLERSLTGV